MFGAHHRGCVGVLETLVDSRVLQTFVRTRVFLASLVDVRALVETLSLTLGW